MATGERHEVEVDHHSAAFHADRHAEWAALRTCPVTYNRALGGFWMVSGYDAVAEVFRDGDTYTSRHTDRPEDGIDYLGIAGVPRPTMTPTLGIAEVEGDVHHALRRVLNPFLAPTVVAGLEPRMREIATWLLDQRIESREIDLVEDLTSPVPAILTMELIGLPLGKWRSYVDVFHGATAYGPDSAERERAVAAIPAMLAELDDEARARRADPGTDMLSAIVTMRLDDGRALTDAEVVGVVWNLVGGGVDTTSSLTSLALHHLDEHRDLRRRLIDRPDLLPAATEEFLRYFSVSESLTRTVTRDVELCGQTLRRGDHVLISLLSANRDASRFERADEVVLERAPNPHLALGVGPHRCIGMHMARVMFRVLVDEVLTRIPDYEIDRDATLLYDRNPNLHGVVRLPARFTPGPVVLASGESPLEDAR